MIKPLCRIVLFGSLVLGVTAANAQTFFGSDNFDTAGPAFDTAVWNTASQGQLTQANGHAALNTGSPSVAGSLTWPSNANFDSNSYTYDWTATVSATLDFAGQSVGGFPFIGLYAKPAEGGYFGILIHADQNTGVTSISSVYDLSNSVDSSYYVHNGVTFVDSTTTNNLTEVLLRLSWDSSAGTLTSDYSFDGGASYATSATITVNADTTGAVPAGGFSLQLYAAGGGATHPADSIYFDNFSVAATAVPEPSTYAMLAGVGVLGLAIWRKRRTA